MRRVLKRLPSPAMVVACIALAIALGGTAWAATLPRNSVGTAQLKRNAVTSIKVRNNSLTGADIRESRLGRVPSAARAHTAASATTAGSATTATSANSACCTARLRLGGGSRAGRGRNGHSRDRELRCRVERHGRRSKAV